MTTEFLFPVVNNKRADQAITLEDFKPATSKGKAEKPDLSFKDGKFTLNKKFVENRDSLTGFVGVLSPDGTQGFLLKSTTEETFEKSAFIKGEKATLTFNSDSLKFVIESAGISLDNQLYLSQVDSKNGWDVFAISNTSTPKVEEELQGIPTSQVATQEEPIAQVEEPATVVQEEAITASTEGEVGQYAEQGVEEVVADEELL